MAISPPGSAGTGLAPRGALCNRCRARGRPGPHRRRGCQHAGAARPAGNRAKRVPRRPVGPAARAPSAPRLRAPAAEAVVGLPRRPPLRGGCVAHQTSQSDPSTGIFSTTSRKKMGQKPSTAVKSSRRLRGSGRPRGGPARSKAAGPGRERLGVDLLEAQPRTRWERAGSGRRRRRCAPTRSSSRRRSRRSRPAAGPSVLVERRQLPVGGCRTARRRRRSGREARAGRGAAAARRSPGPPSRWPRRGRRARRGRRRRSPAASEMQWTIPSISSKRATLRSGGSSKPNRLITPSTSTARIGRSGMA